MWAINQVEMKHLDCNQTIQWHNSSIQTVCRGWMNVTNSWWWEGRRGGTFISFFLQVLCIPDESESGWLLDCHLLNFLWNKLLSNWTTFLIVFFRAYDDDADGEDDPDDAEVVIYETRLNMSHCLSLIKAIWFHRYVNL